MASHEDDEAGGDDPHGAPLPPEDRLWRHPSELAGGTPPPAAWASTPAHRPGRSVAVVAMASACLAGAAAAIGLLWVARPTQTVETSGPATTRPAASFTAGRDLSPEEERASRALTVVQVRRSAAWSEVPALLLDSGAVVVAAAAVADADELAVLDGGDRRTGRVLGSDPATATAVVATSTVESGGIGQAAVPTEGTAVTVVGYRDRTALLAGRLRSLPATIGERGARATVDGQLLHDVVLLDRVLPADAAGSVVLDREGAVVAVVVTPDDGAGTAVAAPAGAVLAAAEDLRSDGQIRRAWLGVRAIDLDPAAPPAPGVRAGAQLRSVQSGSPAASAGLEAGDVIVEIDGRRIEDASDLVLAIASWQPGQEVRVTWMRDGEPVTTVITLGG